MLSHLLVGVGFYLAGFGAGAGIFALVAILLLEHQHDLIIKAQTEVCWAEWERDERPAPEKDKYCFECGNQRLVGDIYCRHCGYKL